MPFRLIVAFVAAQILLGVPAAPVRAENVYVPAPLEPWREWVLDRHDYRQCPAWFDRNPTAEADFVCAWPQELVLDVTRGSAQFEQAWQVSAGDAWLPLPGDADYWPDAVTANGQPVPVVLHDGLPSVRLGAGDWRLAGRFAWDQRPGVLRIPPQSGLVRLSVDGKAVPRPAFNRRGVFLGDRESGSRTPNAIDVRVYRLVADGVPVELATRLRVDVSGTVREETFSPVLPEGYVPLALSSALPVRLEADGVLRVQVRPGTWDIDLRARAPGVVDAVQLPGSRNNLPGEEILSYAANDALRVTVPGGLPPVDPDQAQVPDGWREYPAFRIAPGETLVIEERSRGRMPVDNDLELRRSMWLDFSGDGYTVRDEVSGEMRRDWRLEMQPPYRLESATADGDNLLVTAGAGDGDAGIEIRQADLDLETTARAARAGQLPVTGWDARFNQVATTLYLPPGGKLFAAPGADVVRGSWAGQWQLLDFFLLLLITIAAWRQFGRLAGMVALVALGLSFHELAAPTWLWLNLLLAVALLRVAPAGRLGTFVRAYAAIGATLLLIALVPFVAQQLRIAIYPQLEPQFDAGARSFASDVAPLPAAEPPEVSNLREEAGDAKRLYDQARRAAAIEEIVVTGEKAGFSRSDYPRYAPNAVVQTGPGIPDWQWNSAELAWNGPVDAGQTLRLWILPRWAVSLLRFAEVGLLVLLAALLARGAVRRGWRFPALHLPRAGAAGLIAANVAALLAGALPGQEVRADEWPSPALLGELEARLTRPPDCAPRCAEIAAATINVAGDEVSLLLAVHALADVAVPLPGTATGWHPDAVQMDDATNAAVLRAEDGGLWVRVTPGRHVVLLRGPAGDTDSLEIAFPAPPRVVDVNARGWTVAGLRDRRLLAGTLQFAREQAAGPDAPERWESSRFPPYARVVRTLEMGLDWSVNTTVERIAPVQGALTLRVPLLPGEAVLADGLPVTDGEMLVSMGPDQPSVAWRSRLPRSASLTITAGPGTSFTEVWRVNAGSIWHVDFEGVPESAGTAATGGVRTAEFHPRPGETLELSATRPDAVAGGTLAFDRARLVIEQGDRSRTGTLVLDYRSTRGAQHGVRLPDAAELISVTVDGDAEPLRIEEGVVGLPVLPGEHTVEIAWRDQAGAGWRSEVPAIDLGAPVGNLSLELQLPANRWLLFTRGPRLGPSVLYWSELAALALFAGLLARIQWTPLRLRHWLLLGLGFSTFSWGVLALVAGWLVAVGARERWRGAEGGWWQYNVLQAGIAVLTVLALLAIVTSLPFGLLGAPDMQVAGHDSTARFLRWFADRSDGVTPVASAWSAPLWVYKALILAWALWLSFALLKWLPWTWQTFARDGFFRARPAPAQ